MKTQSLFVDGINLKELFHTPTLSYKDIGMNNLFSFIKENNIIKKDEPVSEDSSGNAGASFAFFCKVAGYSAHVFVSKNANPVKKFQIAQYGAKIHMIEGTREDVEEKAKNSEFTYLGHQYWPEFYDGFRTISYDIFQNYKEMPEKIYIPFSTGTLYLGVYEGFRHLADSGKIEKVPELVAVQPKNACGMYNLIKETNYERKPSVADALTGIVPLRSEVLKRVISNYGNIRLIEEDDIIRAREYLLMKGMDVEFSSAIAFSAASQYDGDCTKMALMTGHGIKNMKMIN
ncbi:pyridoxal-phosphate dependent enzyme [Cuniculiplasma sp. SKW4]|uniref:pyridoxal-phosphate dependent enzyme n=1 Tax=Cuniculiplasma sp. SKW4 TaxID=3400171 RepID=UPI003FD07C4C